MKLKIYLTKKRHHEKITIVLLALILLATGSQKITPPQEIFGHCQGNNRTYPITSSKTCCRKTILVTGIVK